MANEVYTLIIAVYGAFMGTISLIYAIFNNHRQKTPKLSVSVKIDTYNKDDMLILMVISNIGKIPVTIIDYGIKLNIKIPVTVMDYGGKSNVGKDIYFPTSDDAELPKKLEQRETYPFKMCKSGLMKKILHNQEQKRITPISAWVKDNIGKIHESVNIKKHFPKVYNNLKMN